MNKLILAAALVLSASASASSIRYGSVTFRKSSMWVPANKTCVKNGYIFHKTKTALPVEVCEGTSESENNCPIVMKAIIPQPVVDTFVRYEDCSGSEDDRNCTAVPYTVNQSSVNVYSVSSGDSETETVIGRYTIPACANTPDVDAN